MWGAIYIPRIGQEVIIDFLEGDPDRPIIVGRVYHGNNKPPYTLPDEKTKSTLKSDSSLGGDGFNEIRFEDKKGKEQIFVHAERNKDLRVKKDRFEWIGNESHLIVKKDQLELVEGDKHQHVKLDRNEKVDGAVSVTIKMDRQEKVGMKYAMDAGQEIHLKAGMKVIIEGGMQVTMKVGANFVDISPAGVTIMGTLVNINSGGAAGVGSGSSPDNPKDPEEADTAKPGEKVKLRTPTVRTAPAGPGGGAAVKAAVAAQRATLKQGSVAGTPCLED
jgi:type VI secretion system secreted protein VgrG